MNIVYVCQGPPRCDLEGDVAVDAQPSCPWCKKIFIDEDGNETIVEPEFV
jgi:hypothetical protein